MADEQKNGIFVNVPSFIGKNKAGEPIASVRPWEYQDDSGKSRKMVEVKLPGGTQVDGKDASFYTFSVNAAQVDAGNKFDSHHSILMNETNSKTGEPWTVNLKSPNTQDENGNWVPSGEDIICTTSELKESCAAQYEQYKAARAEAREAKEAAKTEGEVSLDGEAKDMNEAKEAAGGSHDTKPDPAR